jgi:hypothetical protein
MANSTANANSGPNPIPILLILFLLKSRSGGLSPPAINTLEIESFLDGCRTMLNVVDKVNHFAQGGGMSSLPDMKKMMEIVENLPL